MRCEQLGLTGVFPMLKLGVTYPLDPALIDSFADQAENLVVVEERRGFLEEQVVQLLARRALLGKPAAARSTARFSPAAARACPPRAASIPRSSSSCSRRSSRNSPRPS